jgi:hypothetical protein
VVFFIVTSLKTGARGATNEAGAGLRLSLHLIMPLDYARNKEKM